MSSTSTTTYPDINTQAVARREVLLAYWELSKPRIATMGLIAVAIGYAMGYQNSWSWLNLFETLLGIGAVAISSSALNQYIERHSDCLMERTANRPLPAGRLTSRQVLTFAIGLGVAGVTYLALRVNLLTAALSLFTLVTYTLIYTPLKRKTALCTTIGAVPGALPPLLGWTAVRGSVDMEAIVLFGILFLWQFPHFLAIVWIYRDQYREAGLKMVPFNKPIPKVVGYIAVGNAVALIPFSLLPRQLEMTGDGYFWAALVLGLGYLFCSVYFLRDETVERARKLVWTSLIYLPLLLTIMLWDHLHMVP
ncbi:Protoheme IX farnesyltransferase 1 [Polystyrenella longa]|uniref:Protoheme IX farnesyltransferase n=1 Tax=Polystyrenella longa TaxID=2528007 RepID=A0A518CHK0_9PLAN|nr:heme o synthase [Polystyrenella longa]QDU78703.1 Protoheme IX farnesyltransferase 1 [Polystyrenella longa]